MTTEDFLDAGQLADYDILGELAAPDGARRLLASRRADGLDVLITIHCSPSGDEGNALSHLAADVNQLAGVQPPHPHLVPVLEGRWLGADSFAVVTARLGSPTLEELLSRREEEFPYARVAAVLRDISAALEWARERHIVHREVRLDTVHLEPGSDQVRLTFVAQPLPATGIPGAGADARTIATLARAMLTRSVRDPERDALPLDELRPGLPARVVEQTEAVLATGPDADGLPDVRGYIASIAMAEEMKRAEIERAAVRREIEEEQARIRAELAAEREAHDRDLAEQARRFAAHRERMNRELARLRSQTERERQRLAREREAIARERERLAATPVAAKGEPTPLADHAMAAPPRPTARSSGFDRRMAAGILALVVVVGASAVAIARRGDRQSPAVSSGVEVRVADSLAGELAPSLVTVDSATLVPAPSTQPESGTREASAADVRRSEGRPARVRPPQPGSVPFTPRQPPDSAAVSAPPQASPPFPPVQPDTARVDSVRPPPVPVPRFVVPRLDSVPRVDTLLPRRDTTSSGASA